MNFIRNMSIRNFLLGIVAILVIVLTAQSVKNTMTAWQDVKEVTRMSFANKLSDHVITASGHMAKERGFTSFALSMSAPADSGTVRIIQEIRSKGDESIKSALDTARSLALADPGNTAFIADLKKVEEMYSELISARQRADRNFSASAKEYSALEWIGFATSFIDANTDMRLASLTSPRSMQTLQQALRINLELKHQLWTISEYAGRERATIANIISTKKPIDTADMEKLNTFRAIVGMNIKPVLRLKEQADLDPEIKTGLGAMEEAFLAEFGKTRSRVYSSADTGNYSISADEWLESATKGIDSVLFLSATTGRMVDALVDKSLASSKWILIVSVSVLVLSLLLGIISIWVVSTKVIKPMLYLKDTMSDIESTGNLATRITVHSKDENGEMALTFNKMIERFHDIIADLHSSIEYLASSSEELSASAIQIAKGSDIQGSKAAQVSTASQELSATIIEVAKNIAAAADTAKDASTVAQKGGEIVNQTIASMNRISTTAADSSKMMHSLGTRSHEIGNIINVIEDIADQTNLLALNAAIEAARAGEQGRGFAVVADEVRKLAEKTMKATKEIDSMIKAMQDETKKVMTSMENEVKAVVEGVRLANDAGGSLKDIVTKVDSATMTIHQVATASEQQSVATEQISRDIEQVAAVVNETSTSAQEIASSSQEIAKLASKLKSAVEMFKTSASRKVA